jgi:hypothetical protein
MSPSAGSYQKLAWLQICLVRRYSPSAALQLHQMQIAFGAQAAYQAATAVVFLKRHLNQGRTVTDYEPYAYYLAQYSDALPVLLLALHTFAEEWRTRNGR